MGPEKEIRIIPRENAVFWMDGNGVWHNEHGPFEHPRIISYFNRSIQKDGQGYFVGQEIEGKEERVYFPFRETAIFVVDIRKGDPPGLVLNTGGRIPLDPAGIYIENDGLFLETPDHLVKFNPQALAKMTGFFTETPQGLALSVNGIPHPVPER